MSDLPEGLSESYFYSRPNGEKVELLNFRREPDVSFAKKKKVRRRLPGSIRSLARPRLIERDGLACHYCSKEMVLPTPENTVRSSPRNLATIEHVVPQSLGGPNHLDNLVLACLSCNNDFGSTYIKCRCEFCTNARAQFGGNR
jgi:5-methylcytosine-specific restriction endonuclease McrA